MKRYLFLSLLVLLANCIVILGQQRGNSSPSTRGATTQTRTATNPTRTPPPARNTDSPRKANSENRGATRSNTNGDPANSANAPVKRKLLSGLNLSDRQKIKVNQIFEDARENNTPKNEVLREINSVLNPRQSEKFKKKIKRIYKNHQDNSDGSTPESTPTVP